MNQMNAEEKSKARKRLQELIEPKVVACKSTGRNDDSSTNILFKVDFSSLRISANPREP